MVPVLAPLVAEEAAQDTGLPHRGSVSDLPRDAVSAPPCQRPPAHLCLQPQVEVTGWGAANTPAFSSSHWGQPVTANDPCHLPRWNGLINGTMRNEAVTLLRGSSAGGPGHGTPELGFGSTTQGFCEDPRGQAPSPITVNPTGLLLSLLRRAHGHRSSRARSKPAGCAPCAWIRRARAPCSGGGCLLAGCDVSVCVE